MQEKLNFEEKKSLQERMTLVATLFNPMWRDVFNEES